MTAFSKLPLLFLLFLIVSCGTVPRLEGTFSSAVNENTMYFESESYDFEGDNFNYEFSTDMAGYGKEGNGIFEQKRFKTTFNFSDNPRIKETKATVKKSPPNPHTFVINLDISTDNIMLQGATIRLSMNGGVTPSDYHSTDKEGKATIIVPSDTVLPIQVDVRYIGLESYSFNIDSPKNYDIELIMEPSIDHLITSVTKVKDIRKKGSYIYINGKKFKKILE